ncbi:MAG: discoidin domain-containing protein, partial [Nakamurella sp.]
NVPLTDLHEAGNIDVSSCTVATLAPGANTVCGAKEHLFTAQDVQQRGYTPKITVTATAADQPFTARGTGEKIALPPPFKLPAAPSAATGPVAGCTKAVQPTGITANSEESLAHYGAEDTPATNAIDGDPSTFWSSGWSYGTEEFPNSVILDLVSPQRVCALNYLPRQGNTNGNIGDYRIYVSNRPDAFGKPVVGGTFVTGSSSQTAFLRRPATGRYVKLEMYSDVGSANTQTSTAAELSLAIVPSGRPRHPVGGPWR